MTIDVTKGTYQSTNTNPPEDINNELVHVEKVYYGKVIMFRTNCPKCEETLFGPKYDFKCDVCGHQFQGTIESLRIEVTSPIRKIPSPKLKKQILENQHSKCFWCNREFGVIYFRYNTIKRLVPNWDHIVPYSYSYSNADDNFVAACSICNSFKSSHVFENIIECKSYLKKRWDKHLRLRKIVLLEDDSLEIVKNCKKNSLSYV